MQFLKKFTLPAFVMLAFTIGAAAQSTTLISPTGDGGFETGTTFAANGWTVVNGASNQLFVGAAAVPSAGTRGAFSGTNSTTWTGQAVSSVNHFYRDVTFPAGQPNITLSFKYKVSVTDLTYDYLRVYLVPTTTTPVAGTQLASANQIGTSYESATAYATVTISIPASAAGTTQRLVFSWRADGFNPVAAVAVDEISLTSAAPGNIVSTPVGGNWSAATTWVGGVVPTANDNVTITDAATVTIDTAAVAATLNVGTGLVAPTVLQYETGTARSLTVGTNITVATNGTFQSNTTGTTLTHTLSLGGNLTNNGVLDFSNFASATIIFTGAANATFGGTGATTDIRAITVNKGTSSASVLELNPTNFTVRGSTMNDSTAGYLTLTNGTFKVSGTFTAIFRGFTEDGYTIPATAGFWLNNPNYTVRGRNGSPTVAGLLRITQGTYNVGTASGNSMDGSAGASFIIEGGTLNTTGRFSPENAVTYTQTGGAVNVCTVGQADGGFGCFELFSTSSVFNMSGGTINLVQASTAATAPLDYSVLSSTVNITGGTLNVGTAATVTNFNFRVEGSAPNVFMNNAAATTATLDGQFNVYGNTTLSPGATINLNGFLYLQRGQNFFNNGTLTGTAAGSQLYFLRTTAGTEQLYGGGGVVTSALQTLSVDNPDGLEIQAGTANQIITLRVNLYYGAITNSNKITIGNGTANATVQTGAFSSTDPGGSFDQLPVYNIGTGSYTVIYQQESTARTTGFEIPPGRIITALTVANSNGVTLAGGNLSVSGAMTLTNGIVTTNAFVLTHNGAATRTNGFVVGNLSRSYTAVAPYTYHVGDSTGTAEYSPMTANVTAGTFPSGLTVSVVDSVLPGLSPTAAVTRYWNLTENGELTATLAFTYAEADTPNPAANTDETDFRIWRNNAGTLENKCPSAPCVDTTANTVTTPAGQTEFSPWGIGALLAPTAASVEVGGRVREANGRGIQRARVVMVDQSGNTRTAFTNSFGYFRFADVPAGSTYFFTATHRRYQFAAGPQVRTINAATDDVNFTSTGANDDFRPEATFFERAPFDFDGDGKTDSAVFRGSENVWYIRQSQNNALFAQEFGAAGDRLAPADFDGDGKTDLAVFRSSEGVWYIWQSASNSLRAEQFGTAGDVLVPADFDRDGKADLSVWNELDGTWRVKLSADNSIVTQKMLKGKGDLDPIAADRDGDGKADFIFFNRTNARWTIHTSGGATIKEQFGQAGSRAHVGDFDGDGLGDLAVYRAADNVWTIRFADGKELTGLRTAANSGVPVLGDFDGDGKYDAANFGGGVWSILQSVNEMVRHHQFGLETDTAIPSIGK